MTHEPTPPSRKISTWIATALITIMAILTPYMLAVMSPPSSTIVWVCIVIVLLMLETAYISMLLAFLSPRFALLPYQLFRGVTAAIFLLYAEYVIHEFFFSHDPFLTNHSEPGKFNALHGFFYWGLPSLLYTIYGNRPPE